MTYSITRLTPTGPELLHTFQAANDRAARRVFTSWLSPYKDVAMLTDMFGSLIA